MKHTLAVLVQDRPGVLSRVARLFSRRGFNIDSLSVGSSERKNISRMTIVVTGDEETLEQVTKQLHKLIEVLKISILPPAESIDRELVMVKISANKDNRTEIMQITDIFRAKIVDVSHNSMVVEMTGNEEKVDALLNLLRPFGIKELVRSSKIAMARSEIKTTNNNKRRISV